MNASILGTLADPKLSDGGQKMGRRAMPEKARVRVSGCGDTERGQ
jgi:hypothetical protein